MINRLKVLELQGYKTFANKTQFGFPGQVTAIVGPNGSGKSNIADSIRWVLGEQAYSLLRGKKTVDMIFSGSEQRPRASMASVAITFDNQTGWLPVEFSEVNVTRRAYRDGDNEYFINNQRVRLKEINELLANSGLGERTYTIIGQGLVDTALSIKPEERRRFFDEAAGIGLYRSRREESTEKLDKTLRNMERVTDLISEIKPRLSNLQKAKEKAAQYNQVLADYRLLLKDWYGFHWNNIQKDLEFAHSILLNQKNILDNAQIEKDTVEEQLNQVQGNLNQNRTELANLHKELAGYHSISEEITKKLAVLEEREKALRLRLSELNSEIENTSEEERFIQDELIGFEKIFLDFKAEFDEANEQLKNAFAELEIKKNIKLEQDKKLNVLRKNLATNEARFSNLVISIKNHTRELESAFVDIENQQKYKNEIENNLLDLQKKELEISDVLSSNQRELSTFEEKASDGFKYLSSEQEKLDQLISQLQLKRNLLNKLEAELKVIIEAEENLTGFSSGTADILKAVNENAISANLSPFLNNLNIPDLYSKAVAATLGETIEGIILSDGSIPDLLNYFSNQSINRTVIISTSFQNLNDEKPHFEVEGAINAASLIHDNDVISKKIKNLLSKSLIVDNRKLAFEVFPKLPDGWNIVTLEGELFDSRGMITAGIDFRTKPLKRKSIRKSLESEINSTSKEIDVLNENSLKVKSEIELIRSQLDQTNLKIREIKETFSKWTFERQKNSLELEQTQRQLKDIDNRLVLINQQVHRHNDELDKAKKEQAELISNLEKTKQEEQELLIINNSNEIDILQKRVMEFTSRKTIAEKMNLQHIQNMDKTRSSSNSIHQNLENLKSKKEDVSKNIEAIEKELLLLNQDLSENKNKINLVSEKIEPLETKVEAIIGVQGKILEDVDRVRKTYSIAEKHFFQAQLKAEKSKDQMDSIRKKIEEDFGLIEIGSGESQIIDPPLPFEGIVATLPNLNALPDGFEDLLSQKKAFLRRLGPVNPDAEKEWDEENERFGFLTEQLADLVKAEKDLRAVVQELDILMKKEFQETFKKVEVEFRHIFEQLFNGGEARLFLEDEANILDSGIEIEATLPGRRKQELGLLSGGERSLTAVALIFALLRISPTPFCILDEVDAMLDESNVVRFGELLRDLSDTTQFIVITHNRNTVQLADVLYGVTMGKDSVSQVISLRMDELTEEMVQ